MFPFNYIPELLQSSQILHIFTWSSSYAKNKLAKPEAGTKTKKSYLPVYIGKKNLIKLHQLLEKSEM